MTDAELLRLLRTDATLRMRRAVRTCLSGNDTQCFTTKQWEDAYDAALSKDFPSCAGQPVYWKPGRGPAYQLRRLGLREVRPDVWAEANP